MARHIRDVTLARVLVCATIAAALLAAANSVDLGAHKFITSNNMYNTDVFPILRDKCGRCHIEGGPAPMSLLVYKDGSGGAYAWAESMREMLVSEAMPPWYVDPTGPPIKNGGTFDARELDVLMTWAVGGAPEGDPTQKPEAPPLNVKWGLGTPDLELRPQQAHVLPAGTLEDSVEVVLPTNLTEPRWVKAADLLPDSPTMVRRASIRVENGPVLALWEPGDDVVVAPSDAAFRVPARATLRVTIDYKKPWTDEQQSRSDRSTVGLYFADKPISRKEIYSVTVQGPKMASITEPITFGTTLTTGGRVLAVRPSLDQPYSSLQIDAVAASGRRVALLKLRSPRPEWPRRYWLAEPVDLAAGTKIEVKALPADTETPLAQGLSAPLQVDLDMDAR